MPPNFNRLSMGNIQLSDEQRECMIREFKSDPHIMWFQACRMDILMNAVPRFDINDRTFSHPIYHPAIQKNLNLLTEWELDYVKINYPDFVPNK